MERLRLGAARQGRCGLVPRPPRSRRVLEDRKDAEPPRIIEAMLDHDVEFVIIGGVAALAHGVQRITRDI